MMAGKQFVALVSKLPTKYLPLTAFFVSFLLAITPTQGEEFSEQAFTKARVSMVETIAEEVRLTQLYLNKDALDIPVLNVLRKVPRHHFVPQDLWSHAYENRPLPIGFGQTISQPYIVAIMTDLIKIKKNHRVLEIGTGSGYQAAILAELAKEVYSIEIIEALGQQAKSRLASLDYHNVEVRIADGYYGWEEKAPFDAIIVTAVASHVPPALIKQLKPNGLMIMPLGSRFMTQQLVVITKSSDGNLSTRQILPVRFVPLTGGH